ncbi:MAG: DUF4136 domain-containing protein [Nitrospirae bacterium]|nr:DUF4136 domain-containing protein [Nitrospirota bacterium]
MNLRFLIAWLALWLLAAGGCAEGPKVLTDSDPSTQFSAFRTFALSGMTDRGYEVGPSDRSPLRGRVKEMVDEQLVAKGLRQVSMENRPDLLVHIFFGVKGQQRVETTDKTQDLYPGCYRGFYPGCYGRQVTAYEYHDGDWVPASTRVVTTHEDHEGTLIVDLADSSKKKLVWRAVIRAVLGDNLEQNFESANKGIAEAFKDYPRAK